MRYRWKILILLMVIALTPILVVRALSERAIRRHGGQLITQARENRITGFQKQIQLLVNSSASVLDSNRKLIESLLLLQARAVEQRLAQTIKKRGTVYFAEAYNAGQHVPPDATPSSFHFRLLSGDATEMLKISRSEQVFKLAPGTKPAEVEQDIARLSVMTPTYREIAESLKDLIFWQYVSLSNGLLSAYPGHNGIPMRFDHREESWYQNAVQAKILWSDPYIDPATRRVVLAATMPIHRPSGDVAGITAMIVPVSALLNHPLLSENIPPEAVPFMVYLTKGKEGGTTGARIVASAEHLTIERRSWRTQIDDNWLSSSDTQQYQDMLKDLEEGTSMSRRMPFKEKDSLWVYGAVHSRVHLVLITPYREILKPAEQAKLYLEEHIDNLVRITGYGIVITIPLVVLLAFLFSRTITKPIHALADGSRKIAEGQFDVRVDFSSKDEIGDMGRIFNSMGPRLKELSSMRNSLALAMEVQQHLLPGKDPHLRGLDIAGESRYCDETGGDYYDFLDTGKHDPGKIGIVVGDVSDHGIPSALLMTTVRAFLRQRAAWPGSISDIVSDVNHLLAKDVGPSGRFMSLFYAQVDTGEPSIRWVRAGHDPALLYDPVSDTFIELAGRGLPLGVFPDSSYEESNCAIQPGQIIMIGTDGIWETMNEQGTMFGKEGMKNLIRSRAHESARNILSALMDETQAFRGSLQQKDDITAVILKVLYIP